MVVTVAVAVTVVVMTVSVRLWRVVGVSCLDLILM
jgi:hypothetical protein